jgi:hypothetical protein
LLREDNNITVSALHLISSHIFRKMNASLGSTMKSVTLIGAGTQGTRLAYMVRQIRIELLSNTH